MHIKNEIKSRKASITELKQKSKTKSSNYGSRHSFELDEHALKNVISDDLFEDAILLSNFNKNKSNKGDDDLEVKLTNKNFSVISKEAKDSNNKKNKNLNLNDSFKSDIKSEIEYNKSAEFAISKKFNESEHIKTEYDKSESRKFYETANETIKTDIESKYNESKKFAGSIKTEIPETARSASNINSFYSVRGNEGMEEAEIAVTAMPQSNNNFVSKLESKKFEGSIKTEMAETIKPASNAHRFNSCIGVDDEEIQSHESWSDDFEATGS